MKMRKKLAALLAAAMIASVMPMTAFAASTNRVTKTVAAKKDDVLTVGVAPELKIELKDALGENRAFYLELENAEWADKETWATESAVSTNVTFTRIDDKILEVKSKVEAQTVEGKIISVPLLAKLTGGEATVTIDANDTVVTTGKYVFATSNDSKAKAKVGDVSTFADSTKLATLTFEESYIGAFKNNKEDSDKKAITQDITLELNNKDFTFGNNDAIVGKLVAKKTFTDATITGKVSDKGQKVTFTVPVGAFTASQRGSLEIKDLEVIATNKASQGDVEVYVNGYFFEDETLVLAKFGEYSTKLATKEVKEFTAGKKETVKFTLEQIAGAAIIKNRTTTFTLAKDIEILSVKNANVDSKKIKIDADDKNVFTVSDFEDKDALKDNKSEFEVEFNIPSKFTGDISVKAEGRSLEETKEVQIAKVTAPVTVEVDAMKVAAGTKVNTGGKITITETAKKNINRGTLVIQVPKELKKDGVEFKGVKDLVLKTTGGIKVNEAKYNTTTSAIEIEVTRQSSEVGSIEISGFEVTASRIIADGTYEIEVGGTAISGIAKLGLNDDKDGYANLDAITSADFLLVGNVRGNSDVVFTIGSNKFTVNGKEVEMDATAKIVDGRTMVPLRFLSVALGIDPENIKFTSGIVTIFEGTKIIQVKNNDKNITINGMTIPMVAAATIVDGRTYVPVTEIGSVFGVTGTWDAAAQTATFK